MEARDRVQGDSNRPALPNNFQPLVVKIVGVLVAFCCLTPTPILAQRTFRAASENFVVSSLDPNLSTRAVKLAEQYRRELSLEWLGYEIKPWKEKCPIEIKIGPHAGGETSFGFFAGQARSEPMDWQMQIFGPPDRVLDAVLPHEITHTIFATHFGRPLPRWADEGACTTVEHFSEREKNHRMLLDFLTSKPSRGIPFNRMFTLKQYPDDILPLYAQGYSVAKYLIAQKGRREFIRFIETGIANERGAYDLQAWNAATRQHYGFEDLSDLQVSWVGWVRNGSKEDEFSQVVAASSESPAPDEFKNSLANKTGSMVAVGDSPRTASTRTVSPKAVSPIASQISIPKNSVQPIAAGWSARNAKQDSSRSADTVQRSNAQVVGHLNSWYARESKAGANAKSSGQNGVSGANEDSKFVVTTESFLPGSIKNSIRESSNSVGWLNANSKPAGDQTLWR